MPSELLNTATKTFSMEESTFFSIDYLPPSSGRVEGEFLTAALWGVYFSTPRHEHALAKRTFLHPALCICEFQIHRLK